MTADQRQLARTLTAVIAATAFLGIASAAELGPAQPAAAAAPPSRLPPARAATATCAAGCADFSAAILGPGTILNAYVPGDTGEIPARGGQDINLKYADNTRPNSDFVIEPLGLVQSFCASAARPGAVLQAASAACRHFSADEAYELDWAPYGNQSGYCAGTAGSPYDGMNVRLVACGTTEGGIFIAQNQAAGPSEDDCGAPDPAAGQGPDYSAYVSGANPTLHRRPYVLTANPGTAGPGNQVQLTREGDLPGNAFPLADEFCYQTGPAGGPRSPAGK